MGLCSDRKENGNPDSYTLELLCAKNVLDALIPMAGLEYHEGRVT